MVQNPTPSPGYNRSMGMSEFSNSGMQNNGLGGGMSSRSRRGRLAGGFAGRNGKKHGFGLEPEINVDPAQVSTITTCPKLIKGAGSR